MEIKVGQWVRTNDNIIDKVGFIGNGIDHDEDYLFTLNKDDVEQFSNYENQMIDYIGWKVSNTPQELIEVGDLIYYDTKMSNGIFITTKNESEWIFGFKECIHKQFITEIWTKTSEDTYTRQWRKDE